MNLYSTIDTTFATKFLSIEQEMNWVSLSVKHLQHFWQRKKKAWLHSGISVRLLP